MNNLMGIENDKDISRVDCAMEKEVEEYEEGTRTAPELFPLCPYLSSPRHTNWNDALCEMFVEQFKVDEGTELTSDDKDKIEKMFLNHLYRLGQKWRDTQILSSKELKERQLKSNQLV